MPHEPTAAQTPRQFARATALTGHERLLAENELIVSKTDPRGVITYANHTFLRMADMTEAEALGAPHSVIRHPEMPRAVFQLLWNRIAVGDEVFAYVVNMARNGDHYWVLAHVTPTRNAAGDITAYHSNRRRPRREAIEAVIPLYAELRAVEQAHARKADACAASLAHLENVLQRKGVTYDEFFFSL